MKKLRPNCCCSDHEVDQLSSMDDVRAPQSETKTSSSPLRVRLQYRPLTLLLLIISSFQVYFIFLSFQVVVITLIYYVFSDQFDFNQLRNMYIENIVSWIFGFTSVQWEKLDLTSLFTSMQP